MNKQFPIRTIALKLLEKIYLKSDCYFKSTINAFELVNDDITKTVIQKAGKYLKDKNLIETEEYASEEWVVTITYTGVDWLEDYHKINPCD